MDSENDPPPPQESCPPNCESIHMVYKLVAHLFEAIVKLQFDKSLLMHNFAFATKTFRDIISEISLARDTNKELNFDLILEQVEQNKFAPEAFRHFDLVNFPIIIGEFCLANDSYLYDVI